MDENFSPQDARRARNRATAATSRANKRERMGEVEFLQQKRDQEKERRLRKKEEKEAGAGASAGTAAQFTAQHAAAQQP